MQTKKLLTCLFFVTKTCNKSWLCAVWQRISKLKVMYFTSFENSAWNKKLKLHKFKSKENRKKKHLGFNHYWKRKLLTLNWLILAKGWYGCGLSTIIETLSFSLTGLLWCNSSIDLVTRGRSCCNLQITLWAITPSFSVKSTTKVFAMFDFYKLIIFLQINKFVCFISSGSKITKISKMRKTFLETIIWQKIVQR